MKFSSGRPVKNFKIVFAVWWCVCFDCWVGDCFTVLFEEM